MSELHKQSPNNIHRNEVQNMSCSKRQVKTERGGGGFGGRGERTGKIDTKIKCETEGKRGREQKGRQMR